MTLRKAISWLWKFTKPYRGWMLVGIIAAMAAAIIEVWTGSLTQQLTTSAEKGAGQSVIPIVYAVFTIILIGVPAKYFMVYGVEKSSALIVRDIRNHLMNHIGKLPVHYLEKQHSGDVLSRLSSDLRLIQQFLTRDLAQWFYHPLLFIGCFVSLIWIQWQLVVFSLLLLPFSLLASQWIGNQLRQLTEEAQENMGRMNSNLQDTLGGMPIVKSYLLSGIMFRSYQSLLQLTLQKKLALKKREAWITPVLFTLMISPIVFSVIYGSYLISQGLFSTGELVAFLYLLNLCLDPLDHIPALITNTFEMSGALKRVVDIGNQPVENQEGHTIARTELPPIEFDNVSFAYEPTSPILQKLSFTVPKGKTIALVGASGGGKSTVFKLLYGFYALREGQGTIKVFGQPIMNSNLNDLRSHFSVVTQDSYLFGGTVAENIAYGKANASMDEVIEAAKLANAHSFIMELPEGYQTEVGERGGFLSGGQRQRIAIARAFLKDAPILLLDEPTSALDTESEMFVQEALSVLMKEKTTIVIAHRLTTIENADEIWVMDHGTIAEAGNHAQLLAKKGLYAQSYHQEFTTNAGKNQEVTYT
ncbi:ABC transporter ATP-binding protein/permease [Paenibacillus sp. MZ04-78.2]|nr:ABC transporter ATP-binding protein [Paenibacillus sp. MZ04-78.2]MCP3771846.1 ABC transporter ATP-binding protein/permease [Paenibacillus sp. MZ04-78.2]